MTYELCLKESSPSGRRCLGAGRKFNEYTYYTANVLLERTSSQVLVTELPQKTARKVTPKLDRIYRNPDSRILKVWVGPPLVLAKIRGCYNGELAKFLTSCRLPPEMSCPLRKELPFLSVWGYVIASGDLAKAVK